MTSHAQLAVAEGAIMLGPQGGPYRAPQGTEVAAHTCSSVDHVDKHYQHAKEALSTKSGRTIPCQLPVTRTTRKPQRLRESSEI